MKRFASAPAALLLITLLIRGSALLTADDTLTLDADAYRRLAEDWRATGVYGLAEADGGARPTAFRPPLYPLLLRLLIADERLTVASVALLHLLLGLATVAAVYHLACRWQASRTAWVPALLVAVDPILLHQAGYVMTETLAALLVPLVLIALDHHRTRQHSWSAALAGIVLGLGILCRPTFLPWGVLIAAALLLRPAGAHRWKAAAAFAAAAACVVFPWAARNAIVFGEPKLTTTHGGYTLLLGNNPLFYRHLRQQERTPWDAEPLAAAWRKRHATRGPTDPRWFDPHRVAALESVPPPPGHTELQDDAFAYELAQRYIRNDVPGFFRATVHRVRRFWGWTPQPLTYSESTARHLLRYAVGTWYAVTLLLALAAAVSLGRRLLQPPYVWIILLVAAFTAVHALYWSDMRMRAPCMPALYLLAAAAIPAARMRDATAG